MIWIFRYIETQVLSILNLKFKVLKIRILKLKVFWKSGLWKYRFLKIGILKVKVFENPDFKNQGYFEETFSKFYKWFWKSQFSLFCEFLDTILRFFYCTPQDIPKS